MNGNDLNKANKDNSGKYSVAQDAKTGALTYTESIPLFKCTNPESTVLYTSVGNCPDALTTKLGVAWARVIKVSADGTVVNVVETFTSIDKKAHNVRFDQYFGVYSHNGAGYRYDNKRAFGSVSTAPISKATGYGYKYDNSKPTSFSNPIAQVVFATVPSTSWVEGPLTYSRWNLNVPKGKSGSIKVGATLITDDTNAAAQIVLAGK